MRIKGSYLPKKMQISFLMLGQLAKDSIALGDSRILKKELRNMGEKGGSIMDNSFVMKYRIND
jgi:hypothetical protein